MFVHYCKHAVILFILVIAVLLSNPAKTQYLLSQFSPSLLDDNVEGDQGAICL